MLEKVGIVAVAAALGAGAAVGASACGEDRGSVEVEGGTGTEKGPTETQTAPKTEGTETSN